MAVPNFGQIVASTWENHVGKTPNDQIHNDYWLFNRLSEGDGFVEFNGGRTINDAIEYAINSTVRSYTDTEPLDVTRIDVFDEFQYSWKEYGGTVLMSELEKAKNQGDGMKFDLLPNKLENLKRSFMNVLNGHFYADGTGNNSKDVGGLALLVATDPTTGSPGLINRSTFTFWRNQQTSGAKSSTAFDNLRSTMRQIYNSCSAGVDQQHPDWVVTDDATLRGYESLLTANERVVDKSKSQANAGFKNSFFMFKDIPVAYDRACTAGSMFMLNDRNLKLAYLKGEWMHGFPSTQPSNQTVEVFKVISICNLYSNNPRRLGVITAIT